MNNVLGSRALAKAVVGKSRRVHGQFMNKVPGSRVLVEGQLMNKVPGSRARAKGRGGKGKSLEENQTLVFMSSR
jgi:hypothetical protein